MDVLESKFTRIKSQKLRHPWELGRSSFLLKLIASVLDSDRFTPGTIIDMGSGDLFLAEKLAKRYPYHQIIAVDTAYTPEAMPATIKPNIVFISQIDQLPVLTSPVKLVLFLDVLEHVQDDLKLMKDVLVNLVVSSKIFVIITVPAYQRLYCSHDQILGHLRRYKLKDLTSLAANADLEVKKSGYFFLLPLIWRIVRVVGERLTWMNTLNNTEVSGWSRGRVVTRSLTSLLVVETFFSRIIRPLGLALPGLSCYLLACKSHVFTIKG